MNISSILKSIEGISELNSVNGCVKARAERDKLAHVAAKLVNDKNLSLSLLFGTDDRAESGNFGVHAVFGSDESGEWLIVSSAIPGSNPRYPSITANVMAAHWYERYLHDMFGIIPEGHPDLRRLVRHENFPDSAHPLRKDFSWNARMEHAHAHYPMRHVKGEGVYEIPVGPIHAGIIEPGHFRFNVAGERILTLEGKLFFTHKGVEKLLEGKTVADALPFIERISGDMAASHALAFCQAIETISNSKISKRARMIRMLVAELERLTMHIHDLSNIGGMGTGFSFIAANGFRIKERLMRLSQKMFGNRFFRGVIIPGGAVKNFTEEELQETVDAARNAYLEMKKIVDLALTSEGFMDRLQTTGILPLEAAKALGALGLPARASGLDRDVRRDHPYAAYDEFHVRVITKQAGDVHARYMLRLEELAEIVKLIEELVGKMPEESVYENVSIKDGEALGAVESWRGEIVCFVKIKNGIIDRCVPRDPSFCNWPLFGIAGPGNIVPDFPLINKSLNLSYSGTDL